jgi:ferrous iron transport protein A
MNKKYVSQNTLSNIATGSRVRVVQLNGGDEFKSKMISMGLLPNSIIEILNKSGKSGPIAIKVNQTRIVIGGGMAEKILVSTD